MDTPLSNGSVAPDVLGYSRLQDVFRSWFWRYYDHFFRLIFYNACWFLSCWGIVWVIHLFHFLPKAQPWHWFPVYLAFVLECAGSIPWSLVVFKVIQEEALSWPLLWSQLRLYFGKALATAALCGFFLGLALSNLRFYFLLRWPSHIFVFIFMGLVATFFIYGLMMAFYQWPILYFQNPAFAKIFYRSFIVVLGSGPGSIFILGVSGFLILVFTLAPVLWFFIGFVLIFSLWVVALEKQFLRYKIMYQDRSVEEYLKLMDQERQRGWRDILKPWEAR